MHNLRDGAIISKPSKPKPPKGGIITSQDFSSPQQVTTPTSKKLDAVDIASAVAMWARANNYRVYGCGTEQLEDGRVIVGATVRT